MGRGPTTEYYISMNDYYVDGSLTCLKPETIKRRANPDFPIVLNIEPTNACNARCYYCPREIMVKEQGINYLKLSDFKMVIDQIGDRKLIMLNLHKDGESMLHRELPQMVAYAKEKQAAEVIHLNTNGTLINGAVGRGIIEAGIDDITVSIDAAREETYQRFKKIPGLAKLESDIREALNYRTKIGSKTRIRVKAMEFGEISSEELHEFRQKWTGVADQVQITGAHSWSGSVNVEITDEKVDKRYPCGLLWYMLAVNSNGKVGLCSVDWDYSGEVGSIYTQSIEEIFKGQRLKKVRRAHLTGDYGCANVCKECAIWVSVGDMTEYLKSRTDFI